MNATVRWTSGLAFAATAGSGGAITLDATHEHGGGGPSPMEAVLVALGGCTGMDVVSILEKMRAPLEGLEIRVSGVRAEEHPRVFTGSPSSTCSRAQGSRPNRSSAPWSSARTGIAPCRRCSAKQLS